MNKLSSFHDHRQRENSEQGRTERERERLVYTTSYLTETVRESETWNKRELICVCVDGFIERRKRDKTVGMRMDWDFEMWRHWETVPPYFRKILSMSRKD